MSVANSLLGHFYQLLRPLGSEGTETLYLAQKLDQDSQVVVKVVPIDEEVVGDNRVTQRVEKLFHDKLQAISQLHHARLAPILDFGYDNINHAHYFYVVMDYYPAGSLADRLAAGLTLAEIAHVVSQVAEALHSVHERELIHQAVKPSNLLLTQGAFPDLQLADVGLGYFFSTLSSRGLSQSAYVRGTSMFMAPEQWEGQAVPASDQYALAVMAYYLLTRQYPFQGLLSQIIQQHRQARPPVPSRLNRQLNATVDKIITRALAKHPAKRFPSVLDFSQAFTNALPGMSDQPDLSIFKETSFERDAMPVLIPTLPPTLPAPVEIAPLHEGNNTLNPSTEMPVVAEASDALSREEEVLSAPTEKRAPCEESEALSGEQGALPVSGGATVIAETVSALVFSPGGVSSATPGNGGVVVAQPVLQLKQAPALPPILPPAPISRVTTRRGRFSLLQKSLVALLLAVVVLLGSGALLLRNIVPSASSQASSSGWSVQTSRNSGGGITISVSPPSPDQTSTVGSTASSTHSSASGSGSTSGSNSSSGLGSTPVAGSNPAGNTGPGSTPTPTPTRAQGGITNTNNCSASNTGSAVIVTNGGWSVDCFSAPHGTSSESVELYNVTALESNTYDLHFTWRDSGGHPHASEELQGTFLAPGKPGSELPGPIYEITSITLVNDASFTLNSTCTTYDLAAWIAMNANSTSLYYALCYPKGGTYSVRLYGVYALWTGAYTVTFTWTDYNNGKHTSTKGPHILLAAGDAAPGGFAGADRMAVITSITIS